MDLSKLDIERLIGVVGFENAADLLNIVDESNINDEDYWIVQHAAEIGFETGFNSAPHSD